MSGFAELNTMLVILVFFLCGQPARVGEFIDSKITNSNRACCVFLDKERNVWIVIRQAK